MIKKYRKFIYGCLLNIIISGFYFVQLGQASTKDELNRQMNTAGGKGWGYIASVSDMPNLVQTVISAFLGLLGIIFLVLIIYAGFNWMTAQGDEEKVTTAKNTLTRAIIGLVIITAAYSITYFVFSSLPDAGSTETDIVGGSP